MIQGTVVARGGIIAERDERGGRSKLSGDQNAGLGYF